MSEYNNLIPGMFRGALQRCRSLVEQTESGMRLRQNEAGLLFNAQAVLRICYVRTLSSPTLLDRDCVLTYGLQDLEAALKDYAASPMDRDAEVTNIVKRAFDGLCVPLRRSPLLVRKTAALSWSIEHAIVGWDTGKILCLPTE